MHSDVPGLVEYVSLMDEPAFVNQYAAGPDVEARETALPVDGTRLHFNADRADKDYQFDHQRI